MICWCIKRKSEKNLKIQFFIELIKKIGKQLCILVFMVINFSFIKLLFKKTRQDRIFEIINETNYVFIWVVHVSILLHAFNSMIIKITDLNCLSRITILLQIFSATTNIQFFAFLSLSPSLFDTNFLPGGIKVHIWIARDGIYHKQVSCIKCREYKL